MWLGRAAQHIVAVAKKTVVRSTVVDSETGEVKTDPIRTSSQTFLKRGHDKVTQVCARNPSSCRCCRAALRTCRATGIPFPHVSREVSSQPRPAAGGPSGGGRRGGAARVSPM